MTTQNMKIEHDISGARFRCDYCPVLDELELCEIRKNLEIEETAFLNWMVEQSVQHTWKLQAEMLSNRQLFLARSCW